MATETTTQIIQENPQIEAYRLGLLESAKQFVDTNLANMPPPPISRPGYQVAGLTPLQQEAALLAREGLGAYEPFLQAAQALTERGQQLTEAGKAQVTKGSALAGKSAKQGIAAIEAANKAIGAGSAFAKKMGSKGIEAGLGATKQGMQFLQDAESLAARRRDDPYAYQGKAEGALGQAGEISQQAYQNALMGLGRATDFGGFGAQSGFGYLGGAGGQFDPNQTLAFMNPYEQRVIQQAMDDIRREGDIRQQGLRAQASNVGAFGGSRQAIAEQELARNVMEQQARTGGQLRMAGYQQAQQQAQLAFEQAKQRELARAQAAAGIGSQAASTELEAAKAGGALGLQTAGLSQAEAAQLAALGLQYGQLSQADIQQMIQMGQAGGALGQAYGSLGQAGGQIGNIMAQAGAQQAQAGAQIGQIGIGAGGQISQGGAQIGALGGQMGQLGTQQAALGQTLQAQQLRDVQTLEALGGRDQAVQQAILDAQRKSNEQLYQAPYEQYAFLSDIYKGTPSSQQVTQISASADPSTAQQIAGLGISGLSAAAGAKNLGIF